MLIPAFGVDSSDNYLMLYDMIVNSGFPSDLLIRAGRMALKANMASEV
jgi:hypothetical protein